MFTCPASAPCCPLGAPRAPICARRPFSACRATRPLASDLLLCMCSRPLLPCMHIVRRTQHGRMPTHIERLRHEHLRRLSSGTPSRRTLDRWAPCRAMLRRAVPCCARSAAPSRQTLDRWAPGRCRGTGRASYNSQGAISLDTPARQCHMATVSWQRSPPTASLRAPPPPPHTHTHTHHHHPRRPPPGARFDRLHAIYRTAAGRACRIDVIFVPPDEWAFGFLGKEQVSHNPNGPCMGGPGTRGVCAWRDRYGQWQTEPLCMRRQRRQHRSQHS